MPIYIDADALLKHEVEADRIGAMLVVGKGYILSAPEVDAVPVVRCGECANAKRIDKNESVYTCTHPQWTRRPHKDTFEESQLFHGLDGNDFCSYGEKKEDKT